VAAIYRCVFRVARTVLPATLVVGVMVLGARGLTWRVGDLTIVDTVYFDLAPGEFVAVIGPNGAGKTSLFDLISGLHRPTSGRLRLDGEDVTELTAHQRARRGLGRTFQSSSVFGSISTVDNVRLAVQARRGGSMRMFVSARARRSVAVEAAEVLERVGLGNRAHARAGSLAHDQKRRLEIALLLARGSRVMLLDEPMAGVSTNDVSGLAELVRGLTSGDGHSVLMVEHRMEVVLDLADRIAVMHRGAMLICDTPQVVLASRALQEAYLGERL
jgi:branched-chain amino acid transport system ATP-binding protein